MALQLKTAASAIGQLKHGCEILDLTDRRVRQLVIDGILPKKSERGRYELIPTVRAYIHWLRDRSLYGEAKARNGNIVSPTTLAQQPRAML